MMDILQLLELLGPWIPGIAASVIAFLGYYKRKPPTKAEDTDALVKTNEAFEKLYNLANEELESVKQRLSALENQNEVMKKEIELLLTCKNRYYKALDYIIDVFDICERKGFSNELPLLDSRLMRDLKKRR